MSKLKGLKLTCRSRFSVARDPQPICLNRTNKKMVEILDETPAFEDPIFIDIWEGINLKKRLEEAHRQLSIAHSMPETVKRTYSTLIGGFRREVGSWFIEEPEEDFYAETYAELEEISGKIGKCTDAMEAMDLHKEFVHVFTTLMKDGDVEVRYPKHWDGLERRTRELMRVLREYLRDGSASVDTLNARIQESEENYVLLRFGIVRNAEAEIAARMTRRFQRMRLDLLKTICALIREKHSDAYADRVGVFMGTVNERRQQRQRVDQLKAELSSLRIRYYTEPMELEQQLNGYREQVLQNDQTVTETPSSQEPNSTLQIALLESQLKHLQDEAARTQIVWSSKPELSTRQVFFHDSTVGERAEAATSELEKLELGVSEPEN